MSRPGPVSVVETPEFLAAAQRTMDAACWSAISLAIRPPATSSLVQAGCASFAGPWKDAASESGARVVYYYHSDALPIFVLTAYPKNERADLSQAERNDFRRLTALLVECYARRTPQ